MFDCLIVGDSIAVGVHQQRPECVSYAHGGWNSWQWNKKYKDTTLNAKTVIISLGSNDHQHVRTIWELQQLRARTQASRVFWVLPAGNLKASGVEIKSIQEMVRLVAEQYGDTVLPITRLQTDGIHPSWAGYKELAEKTK
jgi:lysophospholipase L1-like esterase